MAEEASQLPESQLIDPSTDVSLSRIDSDDETEVQETQPSQLKRSYDKMVHDNNEKASRAKSPQQTVKSDREKMPPPPAPIRPGQSLAPYVNEEATEQRKDVMDSAPFLVQAGSKDIPQATYNPSNSPAGGENDGDEHGEHAHHGDEDALSGALEPMESFDWHGLNFKYEHMIAAKNKELEEAWAEYEALGDLFGAWYDMALHKETSLMRKRHRTQEAFVRQEEEDVDRLRSKYAGVVDAFKQAMTMLD